MASSSMSLRRSTWTAQENKLFERALARYDTETPNRWHNIAMAVGGKTAEDCKFHFQILLDDLYQIESGRVPFPNYMHSS
ncbi:protein RADIALIS-like 3 [Impatiens glandulifera]|uniref:protein RADIALIS-like 3 n=1 Tax=Impatiens glandulifera TaxID=253017 RepID=UPI001FB0BA16|nr:protein RADIALIS-like 3 [Impatiens glandulifera]